jgi:tRNA (mo5U34)-methyltransferase
MASATTPSREQLIEQIHRYPWVHSIDLGNGIVTPGLFGNHVPALWKAIREIDFRGKKVLDIGCWDGLWSFEAEKRGAAEVYATDLITHRNNQMPTFELAAQILNSRAKYFPRMSVYDVDTLGVTDFDVVLFAGVYYHLKDPLRALCTLRRVMKEGATILVEGAIIDPDPPRAEETSRTEPPARGFRHHLKRWLRADPPAPTPARPAEKNDCYARFYYHNTFCNDHSNWWVPTVPCLRQWVECNFFEIEREDIWRPGNENVRYVITARAVRRKDPRYIREEDDLRPFDLNEY